MVKALSYILCFLPLLLNGQGFGSFTYDQPYLAADIPSQSPLDSPPTFDNLALWWHAGDQITNAISSVTNWVDRIQGKVFYWDGKTNAPTLGTNANGTLYVRFNFSALTNSADIALAPYPGTWMFVLSVDNTGTDTIFGHPGPAYQGPFIANGYMYYTPATSYFIHGAGFPKNDTLVDIIVPHANGAGSFSAWTNGVNGSITNGNGDVLQIYAGNVGADWNSDIPGFSDRFFRGKICDILRYTNVLWNAAAISNGHYWRTNFYGGAP